MMLAEDHYVPFLKGKQGEYSALGTLCKTTRDGITPLIDVPRVPMKNRGKPLEEHLDKQAEKITNCWPPGKPLFIDLHDLPLSSRTTTSEHHAQYLHNALEEHDISAITVTGLDRDAAYQSTIRGLLGVYRRGGDTPTARGPEHAFDG